MFPTFEKIYYILFDSITPQNTENRTIAKSLALFFKYLAKYLFFK